MTRTYLILLVCAFGAIACTVTPRPPKPLPEPPQAREACEAFCELRVTLECEDTADSPGPDEIDGTDDDEPCPDVCRDIVTKGQDDPVRACLDTAQTCDAATECIFGADVAPEVGG